MSTEYHLQSPMAIAAQRYGTLDPMAGGPGSGRHSEGGSKDTEEIIHKGGDKHGQVQRIGKGVNSYKDSEAGTYYRSTATDSAGRSVFEHESISS